MSYIKQRLLLFTNLNFTWRILACFISAFGVGISYISMAWLALSAHDSLWSVAIMMVGFWLPKLVIAFAFCRLAN